MGKIFVSISLITILLVSCSLQRAAVPSELPLEEGTTWVYTYKAYEPLISDPAQIIEATYRLTETIVDTESVPPYFIAHLKKDYELIGADPDWKGDITANQPNESWYILEGQKVFESFQPFDTEQITTGEISLAYDFPLSPGKSWCLSPVDRKNPVPQQAATCEFVGKRMVTDEGAYQTAAGQLDDCYELTDYYNGGNIIRWFCRGVGTVSVRYDHAGTRFGFEQSLLSYSVGVP